MSIAQKLEPVGDRRKREIGQIVCGKCGYAWTPRKPDGKLRRSFRSCPNCYIRLALPADTAR